MLLNLTVEELERLDYENILHGLYISVEEVVHTPQGPEEGLHLCKERRARHDEAQPLSREAKSVAPQR